MSPTVTSIIGLCAQPQHGKTTAQRFLEMLGVTPVDDSEPLRRATMERYGLSWDDVSTQQGKASLVARPDYGDIVPVRQAIGDLGKEYESEHGPNYWVERAIASLAPGSLVSFGSVRMTQGRAIKMAGGVVFALSDPRRPSSPYDFDQFDESVVDRWIINDGSLWDLERRVTEAGCSVLGLDFAAIWKERQQDALIASMVHA